MFITYRQRFAASGSISPPTLKIHRPYFVDHRSTAPAAQASRLGGTTAAASLRESNSLQHSLKCALARHLPMPTQIQLPNLARSPVHMRQLQAHDLAHRFFRQLLGTALGPTRFFHHPLQTLSEKAFLPLVSGLGADPVLLAKRPKIERPHCP